MRYNKPLVRNEDEVRENIVKYNDELHESEGLQERMPLNRSWYAYKDPKIGWLFGPSKFIGYVGINARDYLNPEIPMDGRKTESRLQDWFVEIDIQAEGNEEIWNELIDFLSKYNKSPSKLARVNVLKSFDEEREGDSTDSVSVLIIEVVRKMPDASRRALLSKLKSLT